MGEGAEGIYFETTARYSEIFEMTGLRKGGRGKRQESQTAKRNAKN